MPIVFLLFALFWTNQVQAIDGDLAIYQAKLKAIFDPIVIASGYKPEKYNLIVEKSEILNAYATVGNKIVVYTALVDQLKSKAGLAFVLAHELGHLEEHHVRSSIIRENIFAIAKSKILPQHKVVDAAHYLGSRHYSRGSEKEADLFAINIINKLYCKDPGKLEFFEKFGKDQNAPKVLEYLSTHPFSRNRQAYLQEQIKKANCL